MIAIVDYGVGNLFSLRSSLKMIGADAIVTGDADALRCADKIILPGVGAFDTELVEEFFLAVCREAGLTLHLRQLDGTNSHHIIEGAFKAFARALREAVAIDPALSDALPSTKGVL